MDSSSFQQYTNICNPTCILTENQKKKPNAVSHKVRAIYRAGFFASETTGVSTQTTGMHGLTDVTASRNGQLLVTSLEHS